MSNLEDHEEVSNFDTVSPDKAERDTLLDQLIECYPLSLRRKVLELNSNLPIEDLKLVVETTIASCGGSYDMAEAIRKVEEQYISIIDSSSFKAKLSLLEKKGANYISLVQKLEKIAGSDFVLNTLKFEDYMRVNKSLIRNIEMVHETILGIAEEEGLEIPKESLFKKDDSSFPIVEGLPADPRVIGYILTMINVTLRGNKARSLVLEDLNRKLQNDVKNKEIELIKVRQSLFAANEKTKNLVPEKIKADDPRYTLKTGKGYLYLLDDTKKPGFKNFGYDGTFEKAMIFEKKSQAYRYLDIFSINKPKLLNRIGGLKVITININEE